MNRRKMFSALAALGASVGLGGKAFAARRTSGGFFATGGVVRGPALEGEDFVFTRIMPGATLSTAALDENYRSLCEAFDRALAERLRHRYPLNEEESP